MQRRYRRPIPLAITLLLLVNSAQGGMEIWGEQKNRIGFNGRAAFNLEASFKNLGEAPAATDIGPAIDGVDHFYDDGYNRVDSSGNSDGTTWFWGYDRSSQVQEGELSLSSSYSEGSGAVEGTGDEPHWGAESTYARELGWNNSYWWGVVAGFGWHDIRFTERHTFTSDAVRVTDTYVIPNGVPGAPYRGQFDDVGGPVVGATPTRQVTSIPGGAMTSGRYEFDAEAYTLRLGLLFETPFTDWFDLQFGGGALGTMVHGTFSFREETSVTDLPAIETAGEDTETGFAGGGYAELNLSLRISKGVYAQAGVEYLILTDYTQDMGGREVELNFRNGILATLGMTFAF
jgi:hypothetical protein